jgi:hypothetical protein
MRIIHVLLIEFVISLSNNEGTKKHLCFIKFMPAGMLTYAAGHSPNMGVVSSSFTNISKFSHGSNMK